MNRLVALLLAAFSNTSDATPKSAFLLLGPTGDNALRESGVWQGVYEAWCGGILTAHGVDLFALMNTPHTKDELREKMKKSLTPLYENLKKDAGWSCKAPKGDCDPDRMVDEVQTSIWEGRDACAQTASMTQTLKPYEQLTLYLSVPPFVFGSWANCSASSWGKDRLHLAAEKPFGTSLEDANKLHSDIAASGLPEDHLHLVDHWLSFFMVKNLPVFQSIVKKSLGLKSWDTTVFEKIVVTQFEERGLDGRGGFFDKVGQVRDMIQSHLLQVLTLALVDADAAAKARSQAKLDLLSKTKVATAEHGQYEDYLLEPKLSWHPKFADATYSDLNFDIGTDAWKEVELEIVTGKATGKLLYTVEFYQRSGPGVLTYEIGKEETHVAGIKVDSWPLADSSAFDAPKGGFDESQTVQSAPAVKDGNGYIVEYTKSPEYFPNPYAVLVSNLLTGDYSKSFVTYPECQKSWEILENEATTPPALDPVPEDVQLYKTGLEWERHTVEYAYDVEFKCDPANDEKLKDISLYQAKCHPKRGDAIFV